MPDSATTSHVHRTDGSPVYLQGGVLTGSAQEAAAQLIGRIYPTLPQLAREEFSRLKTAYRRSTGMDVNPIASFAGMVGCHPERLETFIARNCCARSVVYLSDPFIIRDLFPADADLSHEQLQRYQTPAGNLRFFPLTTWKKAGGAPLRFGLADVDLREPGYVNAAVRFPVIMIDSSFMDTIGRHDPEFHILHRFRDLMKLACHDYLHASFLYYGSDSLAAPLSLRSWNERMWAGKELWLSSPSYKQNYELLTSIGHRQVMQRAMAETPELKSHLQDEAWRFCLETQNLCDQIRADDPALGDRIEHYLTTNYARFLFHIIDPRDPDFTWMTEQYPAIARDLNIENGKGLVSLLHAHDGVPATAEGVPDVSFAQWFREYMEGMEHALAQGEIPERKTLAARKPISTGGTPGTR